MENNIYLYDINTVGPKHGYQIKTGDKKKTVKKGGEGADDSVREKFDDYVNRGLSSSDTLAEVARIFDLDWNTVCKIVGLPSEEGELEKEGEEDLGDVEISSGNELTVYPVHINSKGKLVTTPFKVRMTKDCWNQFKKESNLQYYRLDEDDELGSGTFMSKISGNLEAEDKRLPPLLDLLKRAHKFTKEFSLPKSNEESYNDLGTGFFQKTSENKKVTGGSYNDFLMRYGDELREAQRYILKMQEACRENADASAFSEEGDMEEVLSNYDSYVINNIIQWIFDSRRIDEDQIASVAISNMDKNGTEPQMVLYAVSDLYEWMEKEGYIRSSDLETSSKARSRKVIEAEGEKAPLNPTPDEIDKLKKEQLDNPVLPDDFFDEKPNRDFKEDFSKLSKKKKIYTFGSQDAPEEMDKLKCPKCGEDEDILIDEMGDREFEVYCQSCGNEGTREEFNLSDKEIDKEGSKKKVASRDDFEDLTGKTLEDDGYGYEIYFADNHIELIKPGGKHYYAQYPYPEGQQTVKDDFGNELYYNDLDNYLEFENPDGKRILTTCHLNNPEVGSEEEDLDKEGAGSYITDFKGNSMTAKKKAGTYGYGGEHIKNFISYKGDDSYRFESEDGLLDLPLSELYELREYCKEEYSDAMGQFYEEVSKLHPNGKLEVKDEDFLEDFFKNYNNDNFEEWSKKFVNPTKEEFID